MLKMEMWYSWERKPIALIAYYATGTMLRLLQKLSHLQLWTQTQSGQLTFPCEKVQ